MPNELCTIANQVKTSELGPGDTIVLRLSGLIPWGKYFARIDANGWEFVFGNRGEAMHFATQEAMVEFFRPHAETLEGFRLKVEIDVCKTKGIAK